MQINDIGRSDEPQFAVRRNLLCSGKIGNMVRCPVGWLSEDYLSGSLARARQARTQLDLGSQSIAVSAVFPRSFPVFMTRGFLT